MAKKAAAKPTKKVPKKAQKGIVPFHLWHKYEHLMPKDGVFCVPLGYKPPKQEKKK